MQDIHDIRPPVMVELFPGWVVPALIAAALLLVLAVIGWIWHRQRRRRQIREATGVPVPPLDAALAGLDLLSRRSDPDPRYFYFDLAAVFKTFIQQTTGIHALEMTTRELSGFLRGTGLSRELISCIIRFQTRTDPYRYAPSLTEAPDLAGDLAIARQLIRDMAAEQAPEPSPKEAA